MKDVGRIKIFFKDPKKKGGFTILKEFINLWILKKEIPFYYFKHVYRKDITNYKDYLGTQEGNRIYRSKGLHKHEHVTIMSNKLVFAQYYESLGIATPKLLSFNHGNRFVYQKKLTTVNSKNDIVEFFQDVLKSTNNTEMFVRPLSLLGGEGCFKLNTKNCSTKIDTYYDDLISGSFICNEVIEQHPEINKIFDKSINTVRILSFIDKENNTEIIAAAMRFGIGDSIVDNGSSGGFFVGVDIETGTLDDKGHQFIEYGGAEPTEHPDTGYAFGGFKIPYFKESCNLVIEALEYLPTGFSGWDVAITPSGPTLIEANENPHLPLSDMAYGGLLKNPHIRQLIKDLKAGYYSK